MKVRLLFLALSLLVVSCKDNIQRNIEKITSTEIIIPCQNMSCWIDDIEIEDRFCLETCKYKYIIYLDSTFCSTCNIEKLYHWREFIDKYQNTSFYFIIAPKSNEAAKILPKHFHKAQLKYPIFIDANYSFIKCNPQIPSDPIYHTLLLNECNQVLLVGSPVENIEIEQILHEIIQE